VTNPKKYGNEFEAMKRDKMAYKLAICRKECNRQNEFSNSLHDALLCQPNSQCVMNS